MILRTKTVAVLLIATVSFACETGKDYPGGVTFENPDCIDVNMDFYSKDGTWFASATVASLLVDDYALESIIITDPSGKNAADIFMGAPPTSDGKVCGFHYPSTQTGTVWSGNVFTKSSSGGDTIYTAENVSQSFVGDG